MTGWLAATGIALVLLASLYAGLSNASTESGSFQDGSSEETRQAEPVEPTPTQEAAQEEPEPTATPEQVQNRLDCREIRGTDYLSSQERTWFLENCVTR